MDIKPEDRYQDREFESYSAGSTGQTSNAFANIPEAPRMNIPLQDVTAKAAFPVVKLLVVIFGPGALLVITLLSQMIVRFLLTNTSSGTVSRSPITTIVNMISIILGLIAVIGIIAMPVLVIIIIVKYLKQKQ